MEVHLSSCTEMWHRRAALEGSHLVTQVESSSYQDIALSLGVDKPSLIMFATDSFAEAEAASAAGWHIALTVRPGNKPLPSQHGYRVISSMQDLLAPF